MPSSQRRSQLFNNTLITNDATPTKIIEFPLDVTATTATFFILLNAKDATGADAYDAWKKGTAQRVGTTVTMAKAMDNITPENLLGVLLGILSGVGVTVAINGQKVQFSVTGKAATQLMWVCSLRVVYN